MLPQTKFFKTGIDEPEPPKGFQEQRHTRRLHGLRKQQ